MRHASLRILITAGPTREYIDPVRYISNESSGRMGLALAAEAASRGHRVTLVHGPIVDQPPRKVRPVAVVSAADMLAACERLWPQHDALIMAAAVADYTPAVPAGTKRKKRENDLLLRLKPTVDILARLSADRRPGQVVIGFALEDCAPRRNAESKLKGKGLDAIVLNGPSAIASDHSSAEILVRGTGWRRVPRGPKARLAARIIDVLEELAGAGVRRS